MEPRDLRHRVDPDHGREQHERPRPRERRVVETLERIVHAERAAVGVPDQDERRAFGNAPAHSGCRHAHRSRPVAARRLGQRGWRGAVPGHPQADNRVALGVQPLADGSHGIRRVAQAVNQQGSADGRRRLEDERPVPVRREQRGGIAGGRGTEPVETTASLPRPGSGHQPFQFREDPGLLPAIRVEVVTWPCVGGRELRERGLEMPSLERRQRPRDVGPAVQHAGRRAGDRQQQHGGASGRPPQHGVRTLGVLLHDVRSSESCGRRLAGGAGILPRLACISTRGSRTSCGSRPSSPGACWSPCAEWRGRRVSACSRRGQP